MSISKKEVDFLDVNVTKIALMEQTIIHITNTLNEIRSDIKSLKSDMNQNFFNLEKEIKEENIKVWKKLEFLDQRINDNFRYVMGMMVTLFSGLYATALGGMLLRLCKWI